MYLLRISSGQDGEFTYRSSDFSAKKEKDELVPGPSQ